MSREDLSALASLLIEFRDQLLSTKERIDAEIRDYPTPIPRCDAQFNHLYEQRTLLADQVARTKAAADELVTRGKLSASIGELIESSALSGTQADALRARLREEVTKLTANVRIVAV
jgi:chorismate mutase